MIARIPDRIIAIDVETTGFSPSYGARIIEIAAVVVEEDRIVSEYQSLVNIDQSIPKHITRINGITTDMVAGQPDSATVMPAFLGIIQNCHLLAHNAIFDINFIRHELSVLDLELPNNFLCTLQLSRTYLKGLENYKLETVARHLLGGISAHTCLHRALDDARLVARIWIEMKRRKLL